MKRRCPRPTLLKHERTCKFKYQRNAGRAGRQQRSTKSADANLFQDWSRGLAQQERIRHVEPQRQAEDKRPTEGNVEMTEKVTMLEGSVHTLRNSLDLCSKRSAIFRKWEVRSPFLLVLAYLISMFTIDPEKYRQPLIVAFLTCQIISCWEHRGIFILFYHKQFKPTYYNSPIFQRFFSKYALDSACFATIIAPSFSDEVSNFLVAVKSPQYLPVNINGFLVGTILALTFWSADNALVHMSDWYHPDQPFDHSQTMVETVRLGIPDAILSVLYVVISVLDIAQPLATGLHSDALTVCSLKVFTILLTLAHQQQVTAFLGFAEDGGVFLTTSCNNRVRQGGRTGNVIN